MGYPRIVACRLAVLLAVLSLAARASAQTAQCPVCHFATPGKEPMHLTRAEWEGSTHARNNVSCENCHGGDPRATDAAAAHRDLIGPADATSPVHASNLARTCAKCHQANAAAFSRSKHLTLIRGLEISGENTRRLSCLTCHGAGKTHRPSPSAIEATCAGCHPGGSTHAGAPAAVRAAVETLDALRRQTDESADAISKIEDRSRRVEAMAALFDVKAAIKDAIVYVHALDLEALNARAPGIAKQLEALRRLQDGNTRTDRR